MIEKTKSSKEITPKKVPRSLNNLLKVEKDLKKMNVEFNTRYNFYVDEISKDLSTNRLNLNVLDSIVSLIQINSYEYNGNLETIDVINVSKYYDSIDNENEIVSKIKIVIDNHYNRLIDNHRNSFLNEKKLQISSFSDLIMNFTSKFNKY